MVAEPGLGVDLRRPVVLAGLTDVLVRDCGDF